MVRYHGYVLELIVVPAVIDDTVVARILIVVPARGWVHVGVVTSVTYTHSRAAALLLLLGLAWKISSLQQEYKILNKMKVVSIKCHPGRWNENVAVWLSLQLGYSLTLLLTWLIGGMLGCCPMLGPDIPPPGTGPVGDMPSGAPWGPPPGWCWGGRAANGVNPGWPAIEMKNYFSMEKITESRKKNVKRKWRIKFT